MENKRTEDQMLRSLDDDQFIQRYREIQGSERAPYEAELSRRIEGARDQIAALERGRDRDLRSTCHPNLHKAIMQAYGSKFLDARERLEKYEVAQQGTEGS